MSKQSKKVLIGEDKRVIAKVLGLKLAEDGIKLKATFNGEELLKILEKERFDLILLDLMMPKMDGFTVLKELQNRGNKTPVIITSNLGQEEDKKKAKKLGAKDYFIKSDMSLIQMVEAIKKYLK